MLAHVLEEGFNAALCATRYGMSAENRAKVLSLMQAHAVQAEVLNLRLPDAQGNMLGYRQGQKYELRVGESRLMGS